VVVQEGFSEDQLAVPAPRGRGGLIGYRIAWARSYLKGMGLLNNSERGIWSTTELGRTAGEDELPDLYGVYVSCVREARKTRRSEAGDEPEPGEQDDGSVLGAWKDQLLKTLKAMRPDAFERLSKRLLREAGFLSVTVTGISGDGRIDGSARTGCHS
jgi:restriction system protein